VTLVSNAYYHVGMPGSAITLDVAQLASQLRMSVFRLARKLRREGEAGVTPTLLAALSTVERHGPLTPGALATHEQIKKPTCTRVIADLLEKGLIERTVDPLDGRVAWMQVTPLGRKTLQRVRSRHNEYLAKRMKRLSADELETLERAAEIFERLTEEESR
jgi:DNA-binding MarR family transcriptional regulator